MTEELFGVTELNEYIRYLLEKAPLLSDIWVRGEISNFTNHYATGHYYFSLKDSESSVRAVMFRSEAQRLPFLPENGMKVILHGRVSAYPKRGEYQIYVSDMQPDGAGALALALEQLRKKLEAEGLFDEARKRGLPAFPERIGLITAKTGAAVQDMIRIIGRRYPPARIVLFPATVQGPEAPKSLVAGLKCFAERMPVDVIIIGRGGGSMEDLWCFNHESVVRAVAESPIPVVSAVGHEIDFTLCDFAADLRASTPSAAAELTVPDKQELKRRIGELYLHLENAVLQTLQEGRKKVKYRAETVKNHSPERLLREKRMALDFLSERLRKNGGELIGKRRVDLSSLCAKLEALSPLGVLSRGYGIVYDHHGATVTCADVLREGDPIRVRLSTGEIHAKVTDVGKEETYG